MKKSNTSFKNAIFSLLIIPLEILLIGLFSILPFNQSGVLAGIFQIIIFYGALVAIILLNKDLLSSQWQKFQNNLMKNFFIIIFSVIFMNLLLKLIKIPLDALIINSANSIGAMPTILILLTSTISLTVPFVEEIVFRHFLFYNIKSKNIKWVMFFVSAIIFGLLHYSEVGSDLIKTIPYMFIGIFLSLSYYYTKNIWIPILIHLLYNLITVIYAIAGLIILAFA